MGPNKVSGFHANEHFEGYLLVRSAERRTDSKGHDYVDMTLGDSSGDINAKNWTQNQLLPDIGSVVSVAGTVQEYNGRLQFRIERIRAAAEHDEVDMGNLTACAPEKPSEMLREINETVESFCSESLKKLLQEILKQYRERLLYFPAAQRMHHAVMGGLLYHTVSMLRMAEGMLKVYPFMNRDLLLSGVILHDLGKMDEMKSDRMASVSDYTKDGQLVGHLVREVTVLNRAAEAVGISGETLVLLEHMLLSSHGEPEYGSPKQPMFAEAEALHWLDIADARLDAIRAVQQRTPAGAFSEKIPGLDRRIYHPDYENL